MKRAKVAAGAGESKTAEAIHRLDAALAAITTSEEFTAYLASKARFHDYSFGNVMMILTARPDATRVAGFHAWLGMGRAVRKGEKGIPILVPHRVKVEDEATGERVSAIRGFGVGYVFDIAQTEGDPIPEPPPAVHAEGSDNLANIVCERIAFHLGEIGVTVRDEEMRQNGYWLPAENLIALNPALNPTMRAKTFCHELAHCLCRHSGKDDRGTAEVVAEAAAFVALSHIGIDSAGYSAPYIATWGRDLDAFRAALKEIEATAKRIVAIIAD